MIDLFIFYLKAESVKPCYGGYIVNTEQIIRNFNKLRICCDNKLNFSFFRVNLCSFFGRLRNNLIRRNVGIDLFCYFKNIIGIFVFKFFLIINYSDKIRNLDLRVARKITGLKENAESNGEHNNERRNNTNKNRNSPVLYNGFFLLLIFGYNRVNMFN